MTDWQTTVMQPVEAMWTSVMGFLPTLISVILILIVGWMLALGWGLAAAVGAVAGMMVAHAVYLDPNMMTGILLYGFAGALLGGIGSPGGAVIGGFVVGVALIDIDPGVFWSNMQAAVDFRYDILNGFVKSFVFGIAVSIIATFEGFDAEPTAEGVSRATTRTVVTAALTVLLLDLILTAFMLRGVH